MFYYICNAGKITSCFHEPLAETSHRNRLHKNTFDFIGSANRYCATLNVLNVFAFLLMFSYRVPDAFRVLATPGIVGEVHVERRHVDHDMHFIDDDLQQRASDE